jgi:hypothetical protein
MILDLSLFACVLKKWKDALGPPGLGWGSCAKFLKATFRENQHEPFEYTKINSSKWVLQL